MLSFSSVVMEYEIIIDGRLGYRLLTINVAGLFFKDTRRKPGETLKLHWTGFTSMRVQGRTVSVSNVSI